MTSPAQDGQPYVVPSDILRNEYASLTGIPTPPVKRMSQADLAMFHAAHQDCPACDQEAWDLCEGYMPARLRGICDTFHVVWRPESTPGDQYASAAYVLVLGEGGPVYMWDRFGPFPDLWTAYRWAADVAAAEIQREFGPASELGD